MREIDVYVLQLHKCMGAMQLDSVVVVASRSQVMSML